METQTLPFWALALIISLAVWTIPWKGVALWKAARKSDNIWFVVLLIVNTAAILEILYIFVFSKMEEKAEEKKEEPKPEKPEQTVQK